MASTLDLENLAAHYVNGAVKKIEYAMSKKMPLPGTLSINTIGHTVELTFPDIIGKDHRSRLESMISAGIKEKFPDAEFNTIIDVMMVRAYVTDFKKMLRLEWPFSSINGYTYTAIITPTWPAPPTAIM